MQQRRERRPAAVGDLHRAVGSRSRGPTIPTAGLRVGVSRASRPSVCGGTSVSLFRKKRYRPRASGGGLVARRREAAVVRVADERDLRELGGDHRPRPRRSRRYRRRSPRTSRPAAGRRAIAGTGAAARRSSSWRCRPRRRDRGRWPRHGRASVGDAAGAVRSERHPCVRRAGLSSG